jgi:hypothetical protein
VQHINRKGTAPPPTFQGRAASDERLSLLELIKMDSARRAQTEWPASRFRINDDTTLLALNSLFNSKCAFCESRAPLQAHLFRPGEAAEPLAKSSDAHLFYVWLAMRTRE